MIGLVVNSIITTYVKLIELWLIYNYACVQRVEINTPEFTISIVKQVIVGEWELLMSPATWNLKSMLQACKLWSTTAWSSQLGGNPWVFPTSITSLHFINTPSVPNKIWLLSWHYLTSLHMMRSRGPSPLHYNICTLKTIKYLKWWRPEN